jgi:hypothetical protein
MGNPLPQGRIVNSTPKAVAHDDRAQFTIVNNGICSRIGLPKVGAGHGSAAFQNFWSNISQNPLHAYCWHRSKSVFDMQEALVHLVSGLYEDVLVNTV